MWKIEVVAVAVFALLSVSGADRALAAAPKVTAQASAVGQVQNSPIRVAELNYYDAGFGAQFNSEVRTSCQVVNSGAVDVHELGLVLQILSGDGKCVVSWPCAVGTLKAGASYTFNAPIWHSTLGIPLHANVLIEHAQIGY